MIGWIRKLLFKPVLWASNRFTSKPDRERIFEALTSLLRGIREGDEKKGRLIAFDCTKDKFIVFSDQHKGAGNGADDFLICAPAYEAALDYYLEKGYFFIALGDCEELWENTISRVKKAQEGSFERERKFFASGRGIKIFGNHDLYWQNDPFAPIELEKIYGQKVPIYEGVVLQTLVNNKPVEILCTHGHQGDAVSDGNWFSKFFISRIWAPLQSLLRINPNTPAYDAMLKTAHNSIMYEWSAAQPDLLLITGHTHQPVFESLTHIERLYRQILFARQVNDKGMEESLQKEIALRKFGYTDISPDYLGLKPSYFNTGCCCNNDGDITGIEIEEDCFRLIKWQNKTGTPTRMILEEVPLVELFATNPIG